MTTDIGIISTDFSRKKYAKSAPPEQAGPKSTYLPPASCCVKTFCYPFVTTHFFCLGRSLWGAYLQEPISNAFPFSSKPGLMGPKTRTITDSKSVLSLFSTDPPSRLGQIRRFTDLPQYHWHRLFATYYLSYLFSNRNQSRGQIGDLSTP